MATEISDAEQPYLVAVEESGAGPTDPLRMNLGAENHPVVTPLRDFKFSFNGLEFIGFKGIPRTVPQDVASELALSGYI